MAVPQFVTQFTHVPDILELRVENKNIGLRKTFLIIWWQICGNVAYLSTKLLNKQQQKLKTKKIKSVNNLWQILGTKLVLQVDF